MTTTPTPRRLAILLLLQALFVLAPGASANHVPDVTDATQGPQVGIAEGIGYDVFYMSDGSVVGDDHVLQCGYSSTGNPEPDAGTLTDCALGLGAFGTSSPLWDNAAGSIVGRVYTENAMADADHAFNRARLLTLSGGTTYWNGGYTYAPNYWVTNNTTTIDVSSAAVSYSQDGSTGFSITGDYPSGFDPANDSIILSLRPAGHDQLLVHYWANDHSTGYDYPWMNWDDDGHGVDPTAQYEIGVTWVRWPTSGNVFQNLGTSVLGTFRFNDLVTPLPGPNLTATPGNGNITLTFTQPAHSNGVFIRMCDSPCDPSGSTGTTVLSAPTSPYVDETTVARSYMAWSAYGDAGYVDSPPEWLNATPLVLTPLATPSVTITPGNHTLTWTWPSIPLAATYDVSYTRDENATPTANATINAPNATVMLGVTNGETWYVQVRACPDPADEEHACGAWSTKVSAAGRNDPPPPPPRHIGSDAAAASDVLAGNMANHLDVGLVLLLTCLLLAIVLMGFAVFRG